MVTIFNICKLLFDKQIYLCYIICMKGRSNMKTYGKLTNKKKEVLDFIKSFCDSNKYPPYVRDMSWTRN